MYRKRSHPGNDFHLLGTHSFSTCIGMFKPLQLKLMGVALIFGQALGFGRRRNAEDSNHSGGNNRDQRDYPSEI